MYAGEVVEVGRVRDIFEAPVHPYTVGLPRAIPRVDVRREWLAVIQGSVPNLVNPPLGTSSMTDIRRQTPIVQSQSLVWRRLAQVIM